MLNFIVVDVKQVKKILKMDKHATIVYVNRLDEFKISPHILAEYNDLLRRFGTKPSARVYAEQGVSYDANYRMRINRDSKAIGTLRGIAVKAKTDPVYLVKENDLPDIGIIISMATTMVDAGVWT
jgi:hypothetical protein